MTYPETLAYLYARLPMFQRIGKAAYKADLSNTVAMMDALGHPEHGLRCVHVAGTNGKGSTSHLIASALQEAGYKVGLHTSPHFKDLRERFRINGRPAPEKAVVDFVEKHRKELEAIDASFFEWGVAFTLHWFRQEEVDIAVIETGMGGRLDSTNVIEPEVSVITTIGWDHMEFLGDTLEAIAGEKAGIMKEGIPVVIGEADGTVADTLKAHAAGTGAPIRFVDQDAPMEFPVELAGEHQERNARTALAALRALRDRGWEISDKAIEAGFAKVVGNTGLLGRWQQIGHAPRTIADVAHNVDGMVALRKQLTNEAYEHLHIVFGMVNDKDPERVLQQLPRDATYYFCKADIPRGMEASHLHGLAASHGLHGTAHATVSNAFLQARSSANTKDLVLVTGSVFVVAEVV